MSRNSRRAAIYARFSTDLQNEKSTGDQIELCRSYARREGLQVIATFEDRAKSGASVLRREGLLSLLAQAREKAFDVLIVEHADRLSRSMRDLSDIHDKFTFLGIEIRAGHSGAPMDTAMIGLFGLVGQMQREEGAKKVRRGAEICARQWLAYALHRRGSRGSCRAAARQSDLGLPLP